MFYFVVIVEKYVAIVWWKIKTLIARIKIYFTNG